MERDRIISRNPLTGEVIQELQATRPEDLTSCFARAREAQRQWAALSVKKRARHLLLLREVLLSQSDSVAALITRENGKPVVEALGNEILSSVDSLTYFAKNSAAILADRQIPLTLMRHRKSTLNYWPLGVVVVISPWNYPFLLPFAEIIMALVAGNAVVFKPSEITPLVGLKIQELIDNAGFPAHLVQTVIGDGALGAALIEQKPAKVFFTGSVATGKKIMAAAAAHLIPVNLELGGKDPMIVLPDADLDYATSAALWGGFSNSGQVCASTERLLVHESIAADFVERLKEKMSWLRQGDGASPETDLGPITMEKQRAVYERQLDSARAAGAEFYSGGTFSDDRRFLAPTLVGGDDIESQEIYQEETFGPVIALTTFRSVAEAVQKANANRYGLLASVITRNISLGEQIARQLEFGSVLINEVTYTAGLAETPWGGVKDSGIGRTHGDVGLLEFVNVRHIHKPRFSFLVFKSPWWFPYGPHQLALFREFLQLYRRNKLDRLRAFPHLLWNFVRLMKTERRL